MQALTGRDAFVADQLFATLDTTVRVMKAAFPSRILLSDTVGFIKKLPHDLVASFRSTLDEAKSARFCLQLVDGADPAFRSHISVVGQVLADIGVRNEDKLLVFNKIDCIDEQALARLQEEFPKALFVSTRNPEDIDKLRHAIIAVFA